jgi:phasin family protein
MVAMQEYVTSVEGANVRVVQALGKSALSVAERVGALGVDTWRTALRDGAANMKTLLAAKDPRELLRMEGSLMRHGFGRLIGFYRDVYAVLVSTKKEIWKTIGSEFAALDKPANALLERAGMPAPGFSNATMRSAIRAASAISDVMDKALEKVAAKAEASLMDTAEARAKVVHVGLPRPKPRRRHEHGETAGAEPVSRSGGTRKRAIPGE